MGAALDRVSWPIAILLAGILGLAPFFPDPHVWEKLKMLATGDLRRGVDVFDLLMHAAPWLLLLAKSIRQLTSGATADQ